MRHPFFDDPGFFDGGYGRRRGHFGPHDFEYGLRPDWHGRDRFCGFDGRGCRDWHRHRRYCSDPYCSWRR